MKGQPWIRALKAVHVASAGLWLGGVAAILLLQSGKPQGLEAFATDLAAYRIQNVLVFLAFVSTLSSGLAYSLLTHWGFLRHRWVTVKWFLAIGLFVLTLGWQSGALTGMVALSDAGLTAIGGDLVYDDFQRTAIGTAAIQLAVVITIFFVSTFKPWGRWQRSFEVSRRNLLVTVALGLTLASAAGISNALVLRRIRAMEVPQRDPSRLADGRYRGQYSCDFPYEVALTIHKGEIVEAEIVRNRKSRYARFAEAILTRIVTEQSPDVDAISGATTTSRCLMMAAATALEGESR